MPTADLPITPAGAGAGDYSRVRGVGMIENGDLTVQRIVRRVRPAEDMDRILELEVAPGDGRIGIEREVGDRERADSVEDPGPDPFHRIQC